MATKHECNNECFELNKFEDTQTMQKKVKPHGVPKLGSYNSLDKT
jgi:hypothetical protein